jgi:hypothetical protein
VAFQLINKTKCDAQATGLQSERSINKTDFEYYFIKRVDKNDNNNNGNDRCKMQRQMTDASFFPKQFKVSFSRKIRDKHRPFRVEKLAQFCNSE